MGEVVDVQVRAVRVPVNGDGLAANWTAELDPDQVFMGWLTGGDQPQDMVRVTQDYWERFWSAHISGVEKPPYPESPSAADRLPWPLEEGGEFALTAPVSGTDSEE